MNSTPLAGQVAVVTGAASGIGLASAGALVSAGARVVMVDRDAAALRAACAPHGDAMIPLEIDLLDAAACASLVPRSLALAGRVDILHATPVCTSAAISSTRATTPSTACCSSTSPS